MSIELQNIDANCNNCKFMERDFEKYAKWEAWNRDLQLVEFVKKRDEAFRIAESCEDPKGRRTLLALANKMMFQFDKSICLQYGNCSKFGKPVSFIPNTCQMHTQGCFENRR